MVRIPNRNIRSSRNQRAGLYFNISELLCQRLNMKGVCGPSRWAINQRPVLSKYGCALRIGRKKYARFEGKQIRNWATVGSTTFPIITCLMENSWQFTWKLQFCFSLLVGPLLQLHLQIRAFQISRLSHPEAISTTALQLVNFVGA